MAATWLVRVGGRGELVRQVLDSLAADAPDDTTILGLVRRAYDSPAGVCPQSMRS